MTADRLIFVLGLCAFPVPALATFGCEIAANKQGYVALLASPAKTATVIRTLPAHTMVSLLENDKPVPKGWAYVAHSDEPDAIWGEGLRGWLRDSDIDECG